MLLRQRNNNNGDIWWESSIPGHSAMKQALKWGEKHTFFFIAIEKLRFENSRKQPHDEWVLDYCQM